MNWFKPYDVFISHAAEDKADLANAITQALREKGFRVWYSSDQLPPGEGMLINLEKGLRQCRFGVIIISEHALKSSWINYELNSLLLNRTTIIPVWHHVTSEQVRLFAPDIANIYALSTASGNDNLVNRLAAHLKAKHLLQKMLHAVAWMVHRNRTLIQTLVILAACMVTAFMLTRLLNSHGPTQHFIEQTIEERIRSVNKAAFHCDQSAPVSADSLSVLRSPFERWSAGGQHSFEFTTGIVKLSSKVSIRQAGIVLDKADIRDAYGFTRFTSCVIEYVDEEGSYFLRYAFNNADTVEYKIIRKESVSEHQYLVTVSYGNHIRSAVISCNYHSKTGAHSEKIRYTGLSRTEHFLFEKLEDEWQLTGCY